jgi:hypothetical protein
MKGYYGTEFVGDLWYAMVETDGPWSCLVVFRMVSYFAVLAACHLCSRINAY